MNKKIGIYLVLGIAVVAAGIFLLQPRDAEEDVRFDEIEHGHGLAVAIDDPERVYIATHEGLFAVVGGTLERIGKSEDDFMGFSVHPTDPNVFFTSGHPHDGGNLGFQKSEDKGITWKKISDGIDGPIDFHSMAVNAIDPTRVYGWYGNQFHRSADGGITWEAFDIATPTPIGFTTDPKNSQVIYAVTIRGVSVSKDEGKTWASLSSALSDQLVTAIVLHPEDDALIVFSRKKGLIQSGDGGATWQALSSDLNGEIIHYMAQSKSNPNILYAINGENELYKSEDGGRTWKVFLTSI